MRVHVPSAMCGPLRSRSLSGAGLLVLSVLAALGALLLPAAGRASAAVPDQWGFAFLDNPNPPSGYVPDPSRQWGSWPSPSANPVTVDHTGLGAYEVHFPQIAGKNGIAHSTAVNSAGISCQVSGWAPNGANEDVGISCFTPGGAPIDSKFTVLWTTSSGVLPKGPSSYAYVSSDISGTLLSSYNSSDGVNAVSKSATGLWKVWLPGVGSATAAGEFQVTSVNISYDVRCKPTNWSPGATGQTVQVSCTDAGGKPLDTQWTLSYAVQRAVQGPAFPPQAFGYLMDNGSSAPAGTDFNSTGAVNTLVPYGAGVRVTMPNIGIPSDHAQVTAYGDDPGYCNLQQSWARSGGAAVLQVDCYQLGGKPVTGEPFFTAYTSAP